MRASWVTFPVAVFVATACAVSVTAGQVGCNPPAKGYVTRDQFAGQYAQALCSSLAHCCAENGVSQDYASCTKGWQAAVNQLLNGTGSTGNYDITSGTNCINEVNAAASQSCQPVPGSLSAARPTCQAVFAGQVPLGAPCTAAGQCAPSDAGQVICAIVPGDGGASEAGGGGQLPLANPSVTIQGAGISIQDVPVCVLVAPGEGGTAATPCVIDMTAGTDTCTSLGMYCNPGTLTCQPMGVAGKGCNPFVVASCAPGNFCASASAGAGTGDDGGGATDAAGGGDSGGASDAAAEGGTTGDAGDGGGGAAGDSGAAGGGAAGICAPAGPVGSPCTSAVMCDATGTCNPGSQRCVAVKNPGDACTSGSQCSIGVCDATTHTCLANALGTTAACNGTVTTP